MSENIMGKIEINKEAVRRYLEEDLPRNQKEKNEADRERESLENIIDINDRDDNVLYQRNLQRLKNANTTITNTKRAAKYSIEQLIDLLKERNQELATNYMSKKPGQIQLEINRLETENQRLEFEITHKSQVIDQTQQLISKYAEMGDYDRKAELESKVSGLRTEITELRNQQKTNSDKINTCKNYEEEYKENTELIKSCRDKAKQYGIELEEKQQQPKTGEAPAQKAGEAPAQKAGEAPAQKAGEAPAQKAGEAPAQKAGEAPAQKAGEAPAQKAGTAPAPQAAEPKELNRLAITVDASGSKVDIYRGKGTESKIDWADKHKDGILPLDKDLPEEIKPKNELAEIYKKALASGDKFVAREILRAAYDNRITIEDAKKQLQTYVNVLEGKETTPEERAQLNISYDLRGIRKSGLNRQERKDLRKIAKKIRDLGKVGIDIGTVEAPWYTKLKWSIQDLRKNSKNRINAGEKHQELGTGKEDEDEYLSGIAERNKTGSREETPGYTVDPHGNLRNAHNDIVTFEGMPYHTDRLGNRTEKTPEEAEADKVQQVQHSDGYEKLMRRADAVLGEDENQQ